MTTRNHHSPQPRRVPQSDGLPPITWRPRYTARRPASWSRGVNRPQARDLD